MTLNTSMPWMHLLMLQSPVSARPEVALLVPLRKNKHRTPLRHPMPLLPWMLWPQKSSRRSHQGKRARNEFSGPFFMRGIYMVSNFLRCAGRKVCNLYVFGPPRVPVRTRSVVCFRHVFECGLWRSINAVLQFTLLIRCNAFLSEALVSVSV